MGKKSSKTETGPSKFAQPYISGAANQLQAANAANAGNMANINSTLQNNMGNVLASTINNPTMAAAQGYTNDVLSGKYLSGNPNLQAIIDNTDQSVIDKANAAIGSRGGAGGSAQAQILARNLAQNEANLRYQDYATERGYQNQGIQDAATLSGANANNIQALLQYLTTQANLPTQSAQQYASAIGGLLGPYNSQTSTPSTASSIAQGVGTALQIASVFSDRRLKTNIKRVGELADGLGVYDFDYVFGGARQRGVMADEVAKLRPWALGPKIGAFQTVNMAKL